MIFSAAMSIDNSLPNDVATLQSMLVAERAARLAGQSEAQYRAVLIEKLKFTIESCATSASASPPSAACCWSSLSLIGRS